MGATVLSSVVFIHCSSAFISCWHCVWSPCFHLIHAWTWHDNGRQAGFGKIRVPSKVWVVVVATVVVVVVVVVRLEGFFRFHSSRHWSSLRAYGLQVFDAVLERPASRQSFKQFRYATVDALQARLLMSELRWWYYLLGSRSRSLFLFWSHVFDLWGIIITFLSCVVVVFCLRRRGCRLWMRLLLCMGENICTRYYPEHNWAYVQFHVLSTTA